MRYRTLTPTACATLVALLIAGCGVARSLTTQRRTYSYSLSLPPAPANTAAKTQFTLDEQVENTYNKYHGGVDWTKFAYQATNSSATQPATVKVYVSLTDGLTASQLDQQATLVETISLTPSESRTVTLDQTPTNDPFRAFLASALSQRSVTTIYVYGACSSADPTATVNIPSCTAQVRVHGSYF